MYHSEMRALWQEAPLKCPCAACRFELSYLYPYLGFCLLHAVTASLVYVMVRGVQRQQAEEEAAVAASRGRMLLLHELGVPGALGREGAGCGAARLCSW